MKSLMNLFVTPLLFLTLLCDVSAFAQASQLDLQVESIILQSPVVAGKKMTCTVKVKNSGPVEGTLIGVRISTAKNVLDDHQFGCISFPDPSLQKWQSIQQTLLPNQSLDIDFFVVFKRAGTFSFTASLIPDSDSNPGNNKLQVSVNVSSPKPVICSFSATTVKPGARFEIRGNWFTTLPALAQPTVKIGPYTAQIDSLTPAAFWATVPCQGFSGNQKVTVTTSAGSSSGKTINMNNPSLSIAALNPQVLVKGQPLDITVQNLNAKCSYSVSLAGQKLNVISIGKSRLGNVLRVTMPRQFSSGQHKLVVQSVGGKHSMLVTVQ